MSSDLKSYREKFNDLVTLVPLLYDNGIPNSIEKLLSDCKKFNNLLQYVQYLYEPRIDLKKANLNDKQTLFEILPRKKDDILKLLQRNSDLYHAVEGYKHKIKSMSLDINQMESTKEKMESIKEKIDNLIKIDTKDVESGWDSESDPNTPPTTVLDSITLKLNGGKKLRKTKRRKPTKRRPTKKRRHTKKEDK